jgi:hypothetical protein
VGQEHADDLATQPARVVHVLVHVPLGIDDHGASAALVADEIGGVRQAPQVILLENHRWAPAWWAEHTGRCRI